MNKGAIIGGAIGLTLLAFLGGYWLSASAPEYRAPETSQAHTAPATQAASSAPASAVGSVAPLAIQNNHSASVTADPTALPAPAIAPPASAGNPAQATPVNPALSKAERNRIRIEVRAKSRELLAKGQNVTTEETLAFIGDVEKLGQGLIDPRYFSTMREMVQYSARIETLNKELAQISKRTSPADLERQKQVLAEIRDLGNRITSGAAALQTYAKDTVADPKKP